MKFKVYCNRCKVKTNHSVIKEHKSSSLYHDTDFHWSENYYIAQCLGCETFAFIKEYEDEDMIRLDEFGNQEYYSKVTVYPEEPKDEPEMRMVFHQKKEFINTPEIIRDMYDEVVSGFNSRLFFLSAMGLRSIIEAVCKDRGVTDGYIYDENGHKKTDRDGKEIRSDNIAGLINGFMEKGYITATQADILHQVRRLGNKTTHDMFIPPRRTVSKGIEIIEMILTQIYEHEHFDLMEG